MISEEGVDVDLPCSSAGASDEAPAIMAEVVADRIVRAIRPVTVLHVGCGDGWLVEALRRRGVDAFGVSHRTSAVQDLDPLLQRSCWTGSFTDSLPGSYDLIVCCDVLQDLHPNDAHQVLADLCGHTEDVLFSVPPLECAPPTSLNIQPPEHWATLFVQHGFCRDVDFDASFIAPWAARFRQVEEAMDRVIGAYERRLWRLTRENIARRDLNIEQRGELVEKEGVIFSLRREIEQNKFELQDLRTRSQEWEAQLRGWERRWTDLEASAGWALLQKLQRWRSLLAPMGSDRDQLLEAALGFMRRPSARELADLINLTRELVLRQARAFSAKIRLRSRDLDGEVIQVEPIHPRPPLEAHRASVDIIICVHNALADVRRCLESVMCHTSMPYSLTLIDDGSDSETEDYLRIFASSRKVTVLRNDEPRGYTKAANQGLRESSADYVVLLNSDTVVTPEWLDRVVACAESDPKIGLVGPLSNTASWQSIPEIESHGDWAENRLPEDLSPAEMAQLVARYSGRLYPFVPFLNGFCLLIRHQVIDEVGCFDETTFAEGYGEENDYALRARKAGWELAIADDAYVYHSQSRSYSHEERKRLSERASTRLVEKHGQRLVERGVGYCRRDRVLEGIRTRSRVMLARKEWIKSGRQAYSGARVLFLLPIAQPGGGANVVIDEANAMREMGVDACLFNLTAYREAFEQAYPTLEIPVVYGKKGDLAALAGQYDALVATFNPSVEWMARIRQRDSRPVRGYYVQDFEPYMYPPNSDDFRRAWDSYDLFPDLARFTKTEWTRQELQRQIDVDVTVVGGSVNLDIFRPRPRPGPEWPERPLRVGAMIRPNSSYRAPRLTMELLRRASQQYRVQAVIFGTVLDDPGFVELPRDFPWKLAGVLNRRQVARLLNEVDIFVDFSSHQAMGLTAMEAMACGACVTVPERGGAGSFARHEENSLVVDTSSSDCCWQALSRLVEDDDLRAHLQRNALRGICGFFPELPAFNIMKALLDGTA